MIASDLTVLNISQTGLAVQTEKPLLMGQTYHLQLGINGQSVTLEGEVVRCNLTEISEKLNGEAAPCYLNGIHFNIERNPLELCFLEILYTNTAGEKRRSHRIKPLQRMVVSIAKPFICEVRHFEATRLTLSSLEILDLDRAWKLMIQVSGRSVPVVAHILGAGKKEGDTRFQLKLELLGLSPMDHAFFQSVREKLIEFPALPDV